MTSSQEAAQTGDARVLTLGGVPLSELINSRRRELTDLVLVGLTDEVLAYRKLPAEALNLDIVRAIELGLDLFLETLVQGHLPAAEEWLELSESAARRAEEGIELASVLAAYHVATRLVMEEMVTFCGPGDGANVMEASTLAVRFLTVASEVVGARYMQERVAITDVDADASAERLRRLLDGVPYPEDAVAAHLLVRFVVGEHRDEVGVETGNEIAARRKIRRVRQRISQEGEDVLGSVSPEGGFLVVLVRDGDVRSAAERVPAMVARLEAAARAPVHAAMAVAMAASRLGAATQITEELLDLVQQLGRPPGVYRISDVAVEYQMTRPGPARTLLAESVQPLVERPELFETLRAFLLTGRDRRATGRQLHVHPNTVDYRLQRVADLLGIDPTDPQYTVTLVGAVLAHGAELHEG